MSPYVVLCSSGSSVCLSFSSLLEQPDVLLSGQTISAVQCSVVLWPLASLIRAQISGWFLLLLLINRSSSSSKSSLSKSSNASFSFGCCCRCCYYYCDALCRVVHANEHAFSCPTSRTCWTVCSTTTATIVRYLMLLLSWLLLVSTTRQTTTTTTVATCLLALPF